MAISILALLVIAVVVFSLMVSLVGGAVAEPIRACIWAAFGNTLLVVGSVLAGSLMAKIYTHTRSQRRPAPEVLD